MSEKPRQLTLDLPLSPRFGRDDFLVSASNEQAYDRIEAWPLWPDHVLCLQGPEGSGKSHLAAIWAEEAHGWSVPARDLAKTSLPHLISNGALVIEDADHAGRDDAALFHLLNMARERKTFILITSCTPPDSWQVATKDLLSRLRLAPMVTIEAPDEALLKAVLVKLFLDRQLIVDISLIDFMMLRMERSLSKARELVEALDREALSRGRRITKAIAADVLKFEALQE
jgi:chromosomal replication initiation ATPase DnaA